MSHEINIGILALQGDIEENIVATRDAMSSLSLNAYTTPVRYPKELESVDGLIIPGGESTVIGNLLTLKSGIRTTLQKRLIQGMPAMGTCAGMIGDASTGPTLPPRDNFPTDGRQSGLLFRAV